MVTSRPSRRPRLAAATLACVLGIGAALTLAAPATLAGINYHTPKFKKPVTTKPEATVRVFVDADRITYDSKTRIGIATGKVVVTYGPYILTATRVVYDEVNDTFKANGSVYFKERNGNVMLADDATMWKNFKEGFAHHLKALLTNDVTITAQYSRMYENGITVYQRATYTACKACVDENHVPAWQIDAKTATHNKNNQTIYYDDMLFRIGGVPVFYMPKFAYPDPSVQRRTGFIWPNLKGGSEYGLGLVTPYFWALAPNYDLTFSPMITTKQGVLGDVEWRHRLATGTYSVRAYGIYELSPEATKEPDRGRAGVRTKGSFQIDPVWSWGWDATAVSDRTFLRDYDLDKRGFAENQVYLTGLSGRNYMTAQGLNFVTLGGPLQRELPKAMPYLAGDYTFDQPVLGGEFGIDTNTYALTRDAAIPDFKLGTEQARSVTTVHWKKQMIGGLGTVITPFANVRNEVTFAQNVPGSGEDNTATAHVLPTAGLDVRLPLVANLANGNSVISPVVQVITAPDAPKTGKWGNENAVGLNFDHTNLFLDDRFSGTDRFEGGTRANAGMTYSYFGSNDWSVRASLGESLHLAGKNSFTSGSGLDGPRSDLVGAVQVQPWDSLALRYEARAEEDLSRLNSQEATASLTFDRISGSLSYADVAAAPAYGRPNDEQQMWGDATLGLGGSWSLFGGLRYDLLHDEFVQKNIGLSYDCECMTAKLSYAERLTANPENRIDRTVKFSVSFRTLGSASGALSF